MVCTLLVLTWSSRMGGWGVEMHRVIICSLVVSVVVLFGWCLLEIGGETMLLLTIIVWETADCCLICRVACRDTSGCVVGLLMEFHWFWWINDCKTKTVYDFCCESGSMLAWIGCVANFVVRESWSLLWVCLDCSLVCRRFFCFSRTDYWKQCSCLPWCLVVS